MISFKSISIMVFGVGLIIGTILYLARSTPTPSISPSLGEVKQISQKEFVFTAADEPVQSGDKAPSSTAPQAASQPFAKLNRWGGDTYLQVGYNQGKEPMSPKIEDNKLKWQGKKQEVHFYTIKEGSNTKVMGGQIWSPFQTLSWVASFFQKWPHLIQPVYAKQDTLRYLNLGAIDPQTMSATYELFQQKTPNTPTIISYLPRDDTFVFYGYREADRDLYSNKVSLPITRYKTVGQMQCPAIYAYAQKTLIFSLYHPDISQNPDNYIKSVEEAISDGLKKYNIEIKDLGHLLYYQDGLVPKQVGRISTDGNFLIFYLYLESPANTSQFQQEVRPLSFLKVIPLKGLREINNQITLSASEEIIQAISQKLGLQLESDNPQGAENQIMNNLKSILAADEWTKEGKRNGIKISPDQKNPDKFEMELILKEKPQTNVFEFNIETKGLKFYYQPELTEDEKDRGNYRPEDIIGSYAVYYDNQDKFLKTPTEAAKYETGKAFHIYRPKITDKTGNSVWGTLSMDETKSILSVTVPRDFLDKASYPISVDPTFGYTTAGASQQALSSNTFYGSLFTTTQDGDLSSLTAYITISSSRKFAIYKHSDSSLIAQTAADTTAYGSGTWSTLNATASLITGTDYVLGMGMGTLGKEGLAFYYDTGTTNQGHTGSISSYPTLDNPITFSSHDTNKYSIYATYTPRVNIKFEGVQMQGIKVK